MNATTMVHAPNDRQAHDGEQIEVKARAILAADAHLHTSQLVCSFREGTLILRGRVRCYYHKQIAQTIVTDIDGVQRIENLIEVNDRA